MKEVFIVSVFRTPIGGFMGSLSSESAPQLASDVIRKTFESLQLDASNVDAVYIGNVLSAGLGQAPARQAAIFGGIPASVDATTINKVCSSGMKSAMIGAQQIQLGLENLVLVGGMESMSQVPHYNYLRTANKYGHVTLTDGLLKDGLWDVYNDFHMGSLAELCAREYNISREAQDEYALHSYKKATEATKAGKFKSEIVPVTIQQKKGAVIISEDEDIYKVIPEKVPQLPPAFEENGTVTAANASNLNDAAAILLLASKEAVEQFNLKPIAKIIGYADAAQAPEWFTTAPSLAIPKALKQAGLRLEDVDYFEINEAYAAVVLANQQILQLDPDKVNVYGGAVAMGHPLGASGARIMVTLTSVLRQEGGKYGVAAICNGGGGASAIVIEKI